MAEPQTAEEYMERFNAHQHMSGTGMETTIHTPCPFCAAPDFFVYPVLDSREALSRGATCAECGRGCRAIFTDVPGGVQFSFVQTCGPDMLPYHDPPMPRDPNAN